MTKVQNQEYVHKIFEFKQTSWIIVSHNVVGTYRKSTKNSSL
ncbi:MAG: hypothetical protein OFPI_26210 [Osedax symbiont Rs2]|nr:MAG: hypothetical protein OFPI_26210 [Osedax symbiont Rs2]